MGDAELIGALVVTDVVSYFYFLLDQDSRLIELEVELQMDERRFRRTITGSVEGFEAVAQLLAS